jgi:hypothetical protein
LDRREAARAGPVAEQSEQVIPNEVSRRLVPAEKQGHRVGEELLDRQATTVLLGEDEAAQEIVARCDSELDGDGAEQVERGENAALRAPVCFGIQVHV